MNYELSYKIDQPLIVEKVLVSQKGQKSIPRLDHMVT